MTWTREELAHIPVGTRDPIEMLAHRRQPEEEERAQEPPDDLQLPSLSVDISSISTEAPPPMLVERLDPEGHTILFGTGGVGKGALACYWIAELVRADIGVLIVDYEAHPAEWSRRLASLAPDAHSSGRIRHYGPREPLRACAALVAAEAKAYDLSVVVVDSAVMACGSDPLKPEVARDYGEAVIAIGLPVLSLAHVTKADDMRYPFGSIFWHNLARTTWSLQGDQSGAVVLAHRKHNNYASLGRFVVNQTWNDGRLMEIWERPHSMHLRDRIAEVLAGGPMSLNDIVDALNSEEEGVPVKRDSVKRTLNKYLTQIFRLSGNLYEMGA